MVVGASREAAVIPSSRLINKRYAETCQSLWSKTAVCDTIDSYYVSDISRYITRVSAKDNDKCLTSETPTPSNSGYIVMQPVTDDISLVVNGVTGADENVVLSVISHIVLVGFDVVLLFS